MPPSNDGAASPPGHTDLMVTPETLDGWLAENPLPDDPYDGDYADYLADDECCHESEDIDILEGCALCIGCNRIRYLSCEQIAAEIEFQSAYLAEAENGQTGDLPF